MAVTKDYIVQTQLGKRRILRLVWSAILDSKTCPLCRALDGRVVTPGSPQHQQFQPPLHPHCRCMWIGVTERDPHIPDPFWPDLDPGLLKYGTLIKVVEEELKRFSISPFQRLSEEEYKRFRKTYWNYWTKDPTPTGPQFAIRKAIVEEIVGEKFSFEFARIYGMSPLKLERQTIGYLKTYGRWLRRGVRQIYLETQEYWKGKKRSFRLFRGMATKPNKLAPINGISSWTSDPMVAQSFSGKGGVVLEAEVPVEYIFADYKSHPELYQYLHHEE